MQTGIGTLKPACVDPSDALAVDANVDANGEDDTTGAEPLALGDVMCDRLVTPPEGVRVRRALMGCPKNVRFQGDYLPKCCF